MLSTSILQNGNYFENDAPPAKSLLLKTEDQRTI